ncbi:MAG: lipoyl synthase [Deltaproteobacteria bacterium]|nr:lipoyl synthase [Deltaproteobacteria bacterium]
MAEELSDSALSTQHSALNERSAPVRRHPEWLKVRMPGGEGYTRTKAIVSAFKLNTVCQEAQCPNIGECWGHGTATFMLMGDVCTRNCRFCAVQHGRAVELDLEEPRRVAEAAVKMGLSHVVVTSVNRDDLADGGAEHFAATARALKALKPQCTIEVLTPDFQGNEAAVAIVARSPIEIYNHNTETVPRLYKQVRPGAKYERSLRVLAKAKEERLDVKTKTGLMLGLGETYEELLAVFGDLRAVGCDILTLGQYLRPSKEQLPVERYVHPGEFAALREEALALGFRHVESGPLVRSSYHAWKHVS